MSSGLDEGGFAVPAVPEPAAAPKSLKSRALQAVAWTLAGDGGSQALRLVSNLVLSRLLLPDAFGVMVVVTVVQQGLYMFSDVGIQPAIVQHKRGDDPVFLNTAWTTQILRGCLLWVATGLLAAPVAAYCHEPTLIYLLPAVGFSSMADGFLSTKVFTSDRHLSLGRLTMLNLGTATFGLVVRIVWASFYPTVWALVAGGLAGTVSRVLLSHVLIPGPVNRFAWDRASLRELMTFGRWVFLSTILTFFALQLDKIVFVRMIPLAMLGVYNHGSMFCRLPVDTVQKIGSSVAFPALSRMRDRNGNLESAYRRLRAPLLAGGGAILAFLILAGPAVVQILYPVRYHDAGWIMQLVAVGLWFQVIQSTNQTALLALGLPKTIAIGNLVKIAVMAGALPLGYHFWNFPGALAAMAVVEIPKYLIEASRVRALGLKGWKVELGMTSAFLTCAAAALGLHLWTPPGGGWGKIGLAALTWLLLWAPILLWARREVGLGGLQPQAA